MLKKKTRMYSITIYFDVILFLNLATFITTGGNKLDVKESDVNVINAVGSLVRWSQVVLIADMKSPLVMIL